jgi:DNA ligase-1
LRDFARLYAEIDESNKTNDKVAAMARYFGGADPADAAWAVHFLIGRRPKRLVNSTRLWELAAHLAGVPPWLFSECYDSVGDLAETIALLLPDAEGPEQELPLRYWVEERLLPLSTLDDETRMHSLADVWQRLDRGERFVFNKLITGAFRVGVSQELVVRALAQVSGLGPAVLAHRLMGDWKPSAEQYTRLVSPDEGDANLGRPYPFLLAHPLEGELANLGSVDEWQIEWKWDGIRAQVIRRQGVSFVWSRGEELITERFPEVSEIAALLPDGTVLDGEILAWQDERPMKFMELQKRIGRRTLTKKILRDIPVVLLVFDLLEEQGVDLREVPQGERRARLERLVESLHARNPMVSLPVRVSPLVRESTWEEVASVREAARSLNSEGFMLKRKDSLYEVGRKRGTWWKWKIDPLTVDAVVMYAQRGSGRRAAVYSDYTFGLWDDEGNLVPFAKAYSGLTDAEIDEVDRWVRRNTLEKFGPVRTVSQELVMELAFEGIQRSTRHKSGLAVRFPRILRWRKDKKPADADTLAGVYSLLASLEASGNQK